MYKTDRLNYRSLFWSVWRYTVRCNLQEWNKWSEDLPFVNWRCCLLDFWPNPLIKLYVRALCLHHLIRWCMLEGFWPKSSCIMYDIHYNVIHNRRSARRTRTCNNNSDILVAMATEVIVLKSLAEVNCNQIWRRARTARSTFVPTPLYIYINKAPRARRRCFYTSKKTRILFSTSTININIKTIKSYNILSCSRIFVSWFNLRPRAAKHSNYTDTTRAASCAAARHRHIGPLRSPFRRGARGWTCQ